MRLTFSALLCFLLIALAQTSMAQKDSIAIFAGGCFWCMEGPFEKLEGVNAVLSGYTGGRLKNPSYKQVTTGTTGHTEAVKVIFDPNKVNYDKLLDVFWRNIDPTDNQGQFVDRGSQYRPGIFYLNEEQKKKAEASKNKIASKFKKPILAEITKASHFYEAEEYHQDYYKKSSVRYKLYRFHSGRDAFLEKTWGTQKNKEKD